MRFVEETNIKIDETNRRMQQAWESAAVNTSTRKISKDVCIWIAA